MSEELYKSVEGSSSDEVGSPSPEPEILITVSGPAREVLGTPTLRNSCDPARKLDTANINPEPTPPDAAANNDPGTSLVSTLSLTEMERKTKRREKRRRQAENRRVRRNQDILATIERELPKPHSGMAQAVPASHAQAQEPTSPVAKSSASTPANTELLSETTLDLSEQERRTRKREKRKRQAETKRRRAQEESTFSAVSDQGTQPPSKICRIDLESSEPSTSTGLKRPAPHRTSGYTKPRPTVKFTVRKGAEEPTPAAYVDGCLWAIPNNGQIVSIRNSSEAEVVVEAASSVAADKARLHLSTEGYTVGPVEPLGIRAVFECPRNVRNLDPAYVVRGLICQNGHLELSERDMTLINVCEVERKNEAGEPYKVKRIYVDLSATAVEKLRGESWMLSTVTSFVTIRLVADRDDKKNYN